MALITCPECGKEISDKAKSCIHCGCPIENAENISAKPEQPKSDMSSKLQPENKDVMKKLFIIVAITVVFVIIFVVLSNCVNSSNSNNTSNVNTAKAVYEVDSEDIDFILKRNIFIFKNSESEFIYEIISDYKTINAYVEDWTLGDILNDKNFDNIDWKYKNNKDSGCIVTFTGTSKVFNNNPKLSIDFYIQEKPNKAEHPFITNLVFSDGRNDSVNLDNFMDVANNDPTIAMAYVDTSACFTLLAGSNDVWVVSDKQTTTTTTTTTTTQNISTILPGFYYSNKDEFVFYDYGNGNTFFDVSWYKANGMEKVNVTLKGNRAYFDYYNSERYEGAKGYFYQGDNSSIVLVLEESTLTFIDKGTYTFDEYWGMGMEEDY